MQSVKKGKTAAKIAKSRGMSRQGVSKRLRKLKDKKLIELSPSETEDARILNCSNEKIFRLTDRGKAYLASAGSGRDTLAPLHPQVDISFNQPEVEKHNFRAKIKILERGLPLPNAELNQDMNNWDVWYGNYAGSRYEITPKHVIIIAKARGGSTKEVNRALQRKVKWVWVFFRRHGWKLSDQAEIVNNGKPGVLNLVDNLPPHEGELGSVDRTPQDPTIHPNNEADADRLIRAFRMIDRHAADLKAIMDRCHLADNGSDDTGCSNDDEGDRA